jgi:two-component system response regulator NreC
MSTSVLIADDHQIVRQGLRVLLEREGFEIVAEASDGQEAEQVASRFTPDIAILDLLMPLLNGLDAAVQIQRRSPRTKSILLTMSTDNQYVLQAFRNGLRGYVIKTQAAADLIQAIRNVLRGEFYVSPGISRTLVDGYLGKTEVASDPLTPREREVLQLVAEGSTTRQIGVVLGISLKTAESHRSSLMHKLEIHETAGLVRYAIRRGLVQA